MRYVFLTFLIGICFYAFGQNKNQSDSLNKALRLAEKHRDWKDEVNINYSLGKLYFNDNEYGSAMPYYLAVDSLAKAHNFVNDTVIWGVLDRSEISRRTFTYQGVEDAHKLQKEALALAKKINSEELIYEIYLRLADMNGLKGHYDKTKYYLDLVYPYYKKQDDPKYLTRIYMNYMNYYYGINDYDKAGNALKKGIDYLKTKNDSLRLARLTALYGTFFRKRKKDCKKAIEQLEKAEKIYNDIKYQSSDLYMYLMEDIALCSKEIGDYKKAAEYFERAYKLKKELVKKANNDLTRKLETKYQSEMKQREIEFLIQQKRNQQKLFYAGIGLTAMTGIFFFLLYRNKQKTTKKLKELDALKSNFFTNISHEFRTPLTLISGHIQQQLKKKNLTKEDQTAFEVIQRNTAGLLELVNQLLDISKIEAGNFKLKVAPYNPASFCAKILEGFSFLARQKDIVFKENVRLDTDEAWFDKDVLEKICTNLLSNAVKYTPAGGTILTEVFVKNHHLHFIVKNTGEGIASAEISKIFERFYQLNNNVEGTGIGLALVKELVALHKGQISVESTPNQWTTFKVKIPVCKKAYKPKEIITKQQDTEKPHIPYVSPDIPSEFKNAVIDKDTEKPIALIVEDHKDLNNYIASLLDKEFIILQAANGKEGIDLALEYIPDIIISDIMMPVKDGIELCNTLKEDERTSHIPIILLTAKAGEENIISGIKSGADAYITKPFNDEFLKSKISQLIETRKKLQKRYSQEVILKPKDIAVTNLDEKFLEKVQKVLDRNLVESSFNIEAFSKAVGMSRMQLHRKIKALTGLSPSEFVRSQRLKLAAQLLKTSDINISQVGYQVGFNDPSYFSKCFKEAYHCTPSEYAKRHS